MSFMQESIIFFLILQQWWLKTKSFTFIFAWPADIDEEDEDETGATTAVGTNHSLEEVISTTCSEHSTHCGHNTTSSDIMERATEKSKKKQEHYRLKRMRDSSDNFIRLSKPLVVSEV